RSKTNLGEAQGVFNQYLKSENTLELSYFLFEGQRVDGQEAKSNSAAHTNIIGNSKDAKINFNSNRARWFNDDIGVDEVFKNRSEIGAVGIILHEILFHADRRDGSHNISVELFDTYISGLQSYSMSILNKELSSQDAISIGILGLGNDGERLYNELSEKYDLT